MQFAIALLLFALVGVSLGLLGGGGSILAVPIFTYVAGLDAHRAIVASLVLVGVTSVVGLLEHARRGAVCWRTGLWFGLAGMLGAFPAGRLARLVPGPVLLALLALVMFATAAAMLRRRPIDATLAASGDVGQPARRPVVRIVLDGIVVGAVTGLVGAGGGFLVVPALVVLGRLPMDKAIGTSLLVIVLKTAAALAGHLDGADVDWSVVAPATGVAVAASMGGARLAAKVAPDALRRGFGWFVALMAVVLLGLQVGPLLGAGSGA
ncbi:MAG: sulfite exporter TauE/SafE family protein [Myxococcota bacterium]|nr:sulfite exporter TauE/SafE family protein [Myxococcota bacterium]MDW8363301.1 sulfite exporter TauE/SafE family protein [Myxococcales bacterium]